MHNKKREKHLGGSSMQRPPKVIALGIKAKGRQNCSRFHETRQDNNCNGKHQRSIEQNSSLCSPGAPTRQKVAGKINMLGPVHKQDQPDTKPSHSVRSQRPSSQAATPRYTKPAPAHQQRALS